MGLALRGADLVGESQAGYRAMEQAKEMLARIFFGVAVVLIVDDAMKIYSHLYRVQNVYHSYNWCDGIFDLPAPAVCGAKLWRDCAPFF